MGSKKEIVIYHHNQSWTWCGGGGSISGGEEGGGGSRDGGWWMRVGGAGAAISVGVRTTPNVVIWAYCRICSKTTPRFENWVVMAFCIESLNYSFSCLWHSVKESIAWPIISWTWSLVTTI